MCHNKWARVTLQSVTHMLTGAMDVSSPNQIKLTRQFSEFRRVELQLCIDKAMSFFTSNYMFPPLALQDLDRFFTEVPRYPLTSSYKGILLKSSYVFTS